uniref:NADH-ubiquinone oxidoreductase chain 5 n=1 Tax=Histiona aroides TaxID=392300 RepID=M4QD24_HISAR|nr:NADH dehydrogenase subunit 5 [Histiona aroides]AGH24090.1 NADH dehydrogenase subunit 5 [Histiona aroides]
MYLLIVFLPLLGSITSGFFGRSLGKYGSAIITTTCVLFSAIFSITAFYQVGLCGTSCYIRLFNWIDSEMLHASWGFLFDSLTVVMLIVVTIVSSLVHIYSIGYMSHDPHLPRFMAYLSLFTFFMLMLVTGDNFVQMFLGWEGVGLCSYLLINFWFTRLQANKAAIKAMVMNRIGDFGLSLGMMAIFYTFKSLDFITVFALTPYMTDYTITFLNYEMHALTLICILLFVGAVGKSSQLGLHTWLPDAMEGPTPVSALIHAATMVTAGVFLVARCSPIFEYAPDALLVVTVVGAMTAFFAATTGMLQNDIKRVIAYSTCSQLGYMAFACGISSYSVGMFHLMNHAFFKALLFLSAGCVIHALADEQDMRRMGGIIKMVPFTYAMMLIGSMSLMGFPFLTGFYSKDVILELAYAKYTIDGTFAHWLGTIAAFFTAFYSFRLVYLTFLSDTNAPRTIINHAHDAPFIMAFPLMILAIGSIFVGFIMKDMMIGLGTDFWGNSLFTHPSNLTLVESEFIPTSVKLLPVALSIVGASLAIYLNSQYAKWLVSLKLSTVGRELYSFLNKRWYFDIVYNEYVGRKLLSFGYNISFKAIDKGVIEVLGPYGLERMIKRLTSKASELQTGYIYHYAFIMLLGITLLITIVGLWDILSNYVDYKLCLLYLITVVFYGYAENK